MFAIVANDALSYRQPKTVFSTLFTNWPGARPIGSKEKICYVLCVWERCLQIRLTKGGRDEQTGRLCCYMQTHETFFWNKANTSTKWKIQVFNAIVRSKLLYGLEAIQLIQTEISKLNAFQNSALSRILKIPPIFIDRSYSNQRMYEEICHQHGCNFEQFGETWRTTKVRLLGHLLRTSRDDPLYQVAFAADGLRLREKFFRRPGSAI